MKMRLTLITVLALLLSLTAVVFAQEESANSFEVLRASLMRPDDATLDRWYQEYLNAPEAYIDPAIQERLLSNIRATKPLPILLDHITYTPSQRNQGGCGNCWVWAGTGLIETKHSVEQGVKDRLSVQYFDSVFYTVPGGWYACEGGSIGDFVDFYNTHAFIPWSNTNAHFQDQAGGSAPHVPASSISTNPLYDGNPGSLQGTAISTTSVTQATAIANIKNVLNQNKAVQFNFFLANSVDWNSFFSFWDNQAETDIWDSDSFCGHTVVEKQNLGHSVVIVGYDDTDANTANHYWIILNSWGAPAKRPSGLFRMKMYMNYQCKNVRATNWYYSRQFQTIETVAGKFPFSDTNSLFMGAKAASTNNIWFRERSTGQPWSRWSMLNGTSSETPAMATFNTRQYMVKKAAASTTISICHLISSGVWSGWRTVSGTTDAAPALATYRNRLYLFKKNDKSSSIEYKSMGTNGVWSAWKAVAGSSTPYAPSVVVHNDQLHLFQTDAAGSVLFRSMQSNGTWGGWYGIPGDFRTNAGPSAAIFDNRIHVVAKGVVGTPNSDKISIVYTGPVGGWSPWLEIPGAGLTSRGPRAGTGPDINTFNVVVTGQGANTLWTQTYVKGTGWNSVWTWIPGYSTAAPSLNTYWFRTQPFPTFALESGGGSKLVQ